MIVNFTKSDNDSFIHPKKLSESFQDLNFDLSFRRFSLKIHSRISMPSFRHRIDFLRFVSIPFVSVRGRSERTRLEFIKQAAKSTNFEKENQHEKNVALLTFPSLANGQSWHS
jgi:hypothetical protein